MGIINGMTTIFQVVNRLEYISNHRRISRPNTFDRFRDLQFLSPYNSPAPLKEAQHENQQRKTSKMEGNKTKNKKEAAANKTKPLLSGISHNSLYVAPPPLPKAKIAQSHSGRVARSQTARNNITVNKQPEQQSFAPKNAGFQAPYLRFEVPMLVLPIAKKGKETGVMSFTFQPTAIQTDVKQAQSRIATKAKAGNVQSKTREMKTKVSKAVKQIPPKYAQSSSSNENKIPSKLHASASTDNVTLNTLTSSNESNLNKMLKSSEIKMSHYRQSRVATKAKAGNVQSKTHEMKTTVSRAVKQIPPKYVQSSSSNENEIPSKVHPSASTDNVTLNTLTSSNECFH